MKKFNKYTPEARTTFQKIRGKYKNILAGTGHRSDKLLGWGLEPHKKLTSFIIGYLKFMEFDAVVAGGALGFDLALSEAAIQLKMPLITCLPFASMGSNWHDKSLLNRVKKESEFVVDVCGDPYQNFKYQERNCYMTDLSSDMITIYNGDSTGGTANCVRYVLECGKPLINLWDDFEKAFPKITESAK